MFTVWGIECTERGKALRTMSTQEVFIQQFASLFSYYNEALSSGTEKASKPHNPAATDEQHRLFAAARLAIQDLESRPRPADDSRRYFAKPGEAEWGC